MYLFYYSYTMYHRPPKKRERVAQQKLQVGRRRNDHEVENSLLIPIMLTIVEKGRDLLS